MRFNKDQKLELLRRVPLFAGLNRRELERIGTLADEIDIPDGYALTREGARGQEFFILLDGQVRVERQGKLLEKHGAGAFFGEIALIDGGPRTATVTTEGPSRLLVLNQPEFHALLKEFPEIQLKVLQALAQRVRRTEPDALH